MWLCQEEFSVGKCVFVLHEKAPASKLPGLTEYAASGLKSRHGLSYGEGQESFLRHVGCDSMS